MNGTHFRRTVRWIPLVIAFCVASTALIVVVWAALFDPHTGIQSTQPLIGNAVGVARTYLFRNALHNTLAILAPLWLGIFVLTVFAYGQRSEMADARRRLPIPLCALALTPLFLPVPYAVFLWRPLFGQADMASSPSFGLFAIAIVQAWRFWPLAILLAPLLRSVLPARGAMLVASSAVLLAYVGTGTPLIMTGGEPYNETHLWATWSFHTMWVSQQWGFGAVMIGAMALITGGIAGLLWLVGSRADAWGARTSPSQATRLGNMTVMAAACSALLPLAWFLPYLVQTWRPAAHSAQFVVDYLQWAAMSLLVLLVTTALGGLISLPAVSAGVGNRSRVVAACFIVGLAAIPVWDWVGLRSMSERTAWYGTLFIVFVAGVTAGLVALWPSLATMQDDCDGRRYGGNGIAALIVLVVAALVTGNQFALEVAASEGSGMLTLATGPALQLSKVTSGAELELATVFTYALTFSFVMALAFAIFHTEKTPN